MFEKVPHDWVVVDTINAWKAEDWDRYIRGPVEVMMRARVEQDEAHVALVTFSELLQQPGSPLLGFLTAQFPGDQTMHQVEDESYTICSDPITLICCDFLEGGWAFDSALQWICVAFSWCAGCSLISHRIASAPPERIPSAGTQKPCPSPSSCGSPCSRVSGAPRRG